MDETQAILPFCYIFLNNLDAAPGISTETINFANIDAMRKNPTSYSFNININDDKLLLTELQRFGGSTLFCLSALKPSMFYARLDALASSLNITIKLGYHFMYSYYTLTEMRKVSSIYNTDFLANKLYREFFENKDIEYAFIGPLRFSDIYCKDSKEEDHLLLNVYTSFAVKNNIPVIIDMAEVEEPEAELSFLFDNIKAVSVTKAKQYLFFFNYPVRRSEAVNYTSRSVITEVEMGNYEEIVGLLKKQYNIGLAMETFLDISNLSNFIQSLEESHLEYLYVSPTYRYKTQFSQYGGPYTAIYNQALQQADSSQPFEKVFVKNPKRLIKEKKKEVVVVKTVDGFTCPVCNKYVTGTGSKISKHNLQFCTIECFRVYLRQPKD